MSDFSMQYRPGAGAEQLSVLGFGCMRFPRRGGGIDLKTSEEMVARALECGVNYFDTAYIYPGIEDALGRIVENLNCRDRMYITSKLPLYLVKKPEHLDKYFDESLRRLRTDHIDYYLMHMLSDEATWQRLRGLGIEDWIAEKKRSGAIRHIGFSFHGSTAAFQPVVDAFPWEFCMIQYNYMDENSQAGRAGLHYAHSRGLPVMIMEPLRGGRLVNLLPAGAKELFRREGGSLSPADWALRWLWDQEEVSCVLSGMRSMDVLEQNLTLACRSTPHCMTGDDFALLEKVKAEINRTVKVGCTGCGYCMPCPKGVDIPGTFRSYNAYYGESHFSGLRDYAQCTILRHEPSSASQCVGCGKCETHCPQQIPIRAELKNAASVLEGPLYRAARWGAGKLKLY